MGSFIHEIDLNILLWIQHNLRTPVLDSIMITITHTGDAGIFWIIIGIVLLIMKKTRGVGIILLLSLAITALIGEIALKHIVGRDRPFINYEDISLLISKPTSFSFPSGHTASSFAAATVLGYYFRKYIIEFFVMASLIAFSRLYLFVHYPSDIFVGMLLGIGCSLGIIYILNSKLKGLKKHIFKGNEQ